MAATNKDTQKLSSERLRQEILLSILKSGSNIKYDEKALIALVDKLHKAMS